MNPAEILAAVAELRRAREMADRTHAAFMAAKTPRQQQDTMDAQHAAFEHLHRLVGDGPGLISLLAAAELGARALESLAKHDIDVLSYAPENRQPDDDFSSEALVALDVFDAAMELGFLRMPAARPEAPQP